MRNDNPLIETIKARRSIRQFTKEMVSDELLNQVLESGVWAPSGKNNQLSPIRDPSFKGLRFVSPFF
jgi:nitroreductase